MSAQEREQKQAKQTKQIFENLAPSDWVVDDTLISGGGQSVVLGVTNSREQRGVFRYLKTQNEVSKMRFYRELGILTDPRFEHKNIVKILDYTKDFEHQWYISERGDSFNEFWENQRSELAENPEGLVELAISIIREICEGLAILHSGGVVHRDIKPANLIIMSNDLETYPVLIDFGVSYIDAGDERITLVEDAVGNTRFSPDVMMDKMDDVKPWLDVFQLSQLLIWMTHLSPVKKWTRPLDWRWVNYDERLCANTVLALKGITAQCSDSQICPQNAGELADFIKQIFPDKNLMEQKKESINLESIRSGVAEGKARRAVEKTTNLIAIEASSQVARMFYNNLYERLKGLTSSLRREGLDIGVEETSFDAFYGEVINNNKSAENLYLLRTPSKGDNFFAVAFSCFVSLVNAPLPNGTLPETSNIFVFRLWRFGTAHGYEFQKEWWITNERNGSISLRDFNMNFIRITGETDIMQIIHSLIEDSEAWRAVYSQA